MCLGVERCSLSSWDIDGYTYRRLCGPCVKLHGNACEDEAYEQLAIELLGSDTLLRVHHKQFRVTVAKSVHDHATDVT